MRWIMVNLIHKNFIHINYKTKIYKRNIIIESSQDTKTVQLSVVTQDQFDNLKKIVEELQNKFGSIPKAELPDNMQLMQDLRRGASLTDAMAALQLSARLESAEKTLEQMISLVTEVANYKGIDLTQDVRRSNLSI